MTGNNLTYRSDTSPLPVYLIHQAVARSRASRDYFIFVAGWRSHARCKSLRAGGLFLFLWYVLAIIYLHGGQLHRTMMRSLVVAVEESAVLLCILTIAHVRALIRFSLDGPWNARDGGWSLDELVYNFFLFGEMDVAKENEYSALLPG